MVYGYVRISSKDQNELRQLIAMKEYGVAEECVYVEQQSGKDFQRPIYQELVGKLSAGDTLVVKSIDRLGRNYDEILEQWRIITKEKQARIVVLDMPLLNTGEERDLTSTLISDIVLQLLSYVAQTEREFIRQRQREGILAAQQRGTHLGRERLPTPECFDDLVERWERKELSAKNIADRCHFSESTFYRRLREYRSAVQKK